ncbi:MAG TPA: hypothetical protein VMD30_01435, partial [Tepidisphaeraceae bacterium]|nr:hypothetical protein [Tepidisphaeraceae bacterium]
FVACIAGLAAIYLAIRRRNYSILFCLLAALLVYSMISDVVLFGTIFGERLLYLPSAFLLIALGIAVQKVRWKILIPIMVVVLSLWTLRLETYLSHWNNRESFYRYCLAIEPKSVKLHVLLADELAERGDNPGAEATIADAIRLEPDSWEAWYGAGLLAHRMHDDRRAIQYFEVSQKLSPGPGAIWIGRLSQPENSAPATDH